MNASSPPLCADLCNCHVRALWLFWLIRGLLLYSLCGFCCMALQLAVGGGFSGWQFQARIRAAHAGGCTAVQVCAGDGKLQLLMKEWWLAWDEGPDDE